MNVKRTTAALLILIVAANYAAFASGEPQSGNLVHKMTRLVFQLALIIFAARIGNCTVRKLKMPSVLGEFIAGIIIGPYLLGKIPLPGFPHGLFGMAVDTGFPVASEVYSFATIASIMLLFFAGLETDIRMFLHFALAGSIIGIGGVAVSFIIGIISGHFLLNVPITDPKCLFLGVMSTATSVGITTRILSDRRKMDSPEGVTIMAGAVIDDILGIILLAVVLAYSLSLKQGGNNAVTWTRIGSIALKAVAVWLGFMIVGLFFSNRIATFLKSFKNERILTILAFGMALLVAGIFEQAGLAMIIGAYVMGLILSNTDLHYLLQEHLKGLHIFLVPILFTVMGMLIDVRILADPYILFAGLVFTVGAIIAKIIGCSIPALFLNFNGRGAMSIGLGMIPRCEVVLIIAGIGLSYGILDNRVLGIAVILIFISMLVAPPLLNRSLKSRKPATRKRVIIEEKISLTYEYPHEELTDMFANHMIKEFKERGFFVCIVGLDAVVHRITKERTMISMFKNPSSIVYKAHEEDIDLIKSVVYDTYDAIHGIIGKLEKMQRPS